MEMKIGHYMGPLGEAQSNALGAQLSRLVTSVELFLAPVDPGEECALERCVFASPLETALLDGEISMAIVNMTDVGLLLPDGLKLAAVTQRIDPREAVVNVNALPLSDLPEGARVYVNTVRRLRQLRGVRADLEIELAPMGTEQALEIVRSDADASAIVSRADLRWLGVEAEIGQLMSIDKMMPGAGQGALGLLVVEGDAAAERTAKLAHHRPSFACIRAERECLAALGWSSGTPASAHAITEESGYVAIQARVFDREGHVVVEASGNAKPEDSEALGRRVANDLLLTGAREVIDEAKVLLE